MTSEHLPAVLSVGNVQIHQDDGLYSLNDLHQASGGDPKHRPNYFLGTEQTQALIAEISNAGFPAFKSRRGATGGTYACRELVIAYAAWISAAFHLKVIRVFLDITAPAQAAMPPPASAPLPPPAPVMTRAVQFVVPAACQHTRWLVQFDYQGMETVTQLAPNTHILTPGHLTRLLMHNPADLGLSVSQLLTIAGAISRSVRLTSFNLLENTERSANARGIKPAPVPSLASLHGQINSLGQSDAAAAEVRA